MKRIYLVIMVVLGGMAFQGCETTELELLNDPNNLTSGDPQFLLNNIQNSYRASQVIFNDRSSELTRIDYMFGITYFANYGAATLNTPWGTLYSTIVTDVQAIEAARTEDNTLAHHLGMAKVMQAHVMMQLVDFLGDIVPLTEAGNPTEFPTPNPTADKGVSNYAEALALLDEAIALLSEESSTDNVQDLYFGNETDGGESDASLWIRFANTLKMRAALTTGDYATFNNLEATGNYISDTSHDMQFDFGTQLAPVNTQHQDYQVDYTSAGAGIYQSNWLMNLMLNNNDPRIRYYFYRQNDCTPGATCNSAGNAETLVCSVESIPSHLEGTLNEDIWCFLESGYWGRTHGNNRGIPPDNFTRTVVGVYPAGGLFDDDSFGNVNLGLGGNGGGIEPIMLASYVDFWKAEVALAQGNVSMAADYMEAGITKSIAKVQGFISLDGSADTSFEPSNDDVQDFIDDQKDALIDADTDDERWNILAENYWVTLFGGGADAHNFYRRTGYPNTVSDNWGNAPGEYPRVFLYPSNEVSTNPNFTQRTTNGDSNDTVFWNVGQSLPSAN